MGKSPSFGPVIPCQRWKRSACRLVRGSFSLPVSFVHNRPSLDPQFLDNDSNSHTHTHPMLDWAYYLVAEDTEEDLSTMAEWDP